MAASSTSSNSKAQCVKQIDGAATTAGVDYENSMCLLVLLRLLEDENVEEFYIAQNVEGCGAFDDLVIKVKYNSSTTAKLILVQLKHSARNVTITALAGVEGKGDFQLKKYFESYKTICSKIGQFENDILNDCNLEDMTFVLFTNAKCAVGDKRQRRSSFCYRKLLETGNNECDVFEIDSSKQFQKFHSEMEKNKNPIIQEENGLKFLQKLVIFSKQSNVKGLRNIIEEKLRDYFARDNVTIELALQKALNFITKNSSKWLSRHSGVLSGIEFLYQGITVKISEAEHFWTTSITRIIIMNHICSDMENDIVYMGRKMEKSEDYYVDRSLHRLNQIQVNEATWRTIISQDPLVLICGAPGMGKSCFFTRQAEIIKLQNPKKYIMRKNLVDFSKYFNKMDVEGDVVYAARMFLEEISGVLPGTLEYEIFIYSLHAKDMMVIFLDGVDEISPNYYKKLLVVVQTIRWAFQVQLLVSTRPVVRERMENDLAVIHWTLEQFKRDDSVLFFKKFCKEEDQDAVEPARQSAIRDLLYIPIFCKMVGGIINESSDTGNIFKNLSNKTQIYDKFVDVMFDVYHRDKLNIDVNIPGVQDLLELKKNFVLEQHETLALLEIFDKGSLQLPKEIIESESKEFLTKISEGKEKTGFIVNIKDRRPEFLHRTIAEYFCGRWFARNESKYKELVNNKNYLPEEVDYFMSHKLPNQHKLFITILNVREQEEIEAALAEFKSEVNILDPLNRSALYYVSLSANKLALRYLLYNGFVSDEMVTDSELGYDDLIGSEIVLYWLNSVLLKYKKCGNNVTHLISLLMFDFDKETVFLLLHNSKHSPLHTAILKENKQAIAELLNSEDINSRNVLGLTALHLAVYMKDGDTVQTLAKREAEYSNDNVCGMYPHQMNPRGTDIKQSIKSFYVNCIKEDIAVLEVINEDYASQGLILHDAVRKMDLERVKHLVNCEGCDINQIDSKGRSALHVAMTGTGSFERDKLIVGTLQRVNYVQDFNGLYPHCYDQDDEYQWLLGYAFACGLELLPEDDKKIFNKEIEDLIFRETCGISIFKKGIRVRTRQKLDPNL